MNTLFKIIGTSVVGIILGAIALVAILIPAQFFAGDITVTQMGVVLAESLMSENPWWLLAIVMIEAAVLVHVASQENAEGRWRMVVPLICTLLVLCWIVWVVAEDLISWGSVSRSVSISAEFIAYNPALVLAVALGAIGYHAFQALQLRKAHMKRQTL